MFCQSKSRSWLMTKNKMNKTLKLSTHLPLRVTTTILRCNLCNLPISRMCPPRVDWCHIQRPDVRLPAAVAAAAGQAAPRGVLSQRHFGPALPKHGHFLILNGWSGATSEPREHDPRGASGERSNCLSHQMCIGLDCCQESSSHSPWTRESDVGR